MTKELKNYEKELAAQQKRVDDMKARGDDEHEIRQQVRGRRAGWLAATRPGGLTGDVGADNAVARTRGAQERVLLETVQIIPDTTRRLNEATEALRRMEGDATPEASRV